MHFSYNICDRNYPWNKQPDYDLEKAFESIESLLEKDSDVNQMQKERKATSEGDEGKTRMQLIQQITKGTERIYNNKKR